MSKDFSVHHQNPKDAGKMILKIIWKSQGIPDSQNNLEKEEAGGPTLLISKLTTKTNEIESPEVNLHV